MGTVYAIYSRKSVADAHSESVENQVAMCREYIARRLDPGSEGTVRVYEDRGFSAKDTRRPRFQQLLSDLRAGTVDWVVCYRLDRISRNVGDFAALVEELGRRGVQLVCIAEEFDSSRPVGRAMMYMASVFAQLERETTAQRVRDNMLELARSGRWLGGTPPTGYRVRRVTVVDTSGRERVHSVLERREEETELVRTAFRAALEEGSLGGVRRRLAAQGLRGRTGKMLSLPGLRDLLRNPVYCAADREAYAWFRDRGAQLAFKEADCCQDRGLTAYNKRGESGARTVRNPVDRWVVALGTHPPLVPGREWVAAQRLTAVPVRRESPPRNSYGLLSGLVRCGRCGAPLRVKRHPRFDENGRFYYICENKLQKGLEHCALPNLPGPATDEAVCRELESRLHNGPAFWTALEELARDPAQRDARAELEAALDRRLTQLDRLVELAGQDDGTGAFWERAALRIRALEAECGSLRERLAELEQPETAPSERAVRLARMGINPEGAAARMDLAERRELTRLLVREALWDGAALRLELSG